MSARVEIADLIERWLEFIQEDRLLGRLFEILGLGIIQVRSESVAIRKRSEIAGHWSKQGLEVASCSHHRSVLLHAKELLDAFNFVAIQGTAKDEQANDR
jgi:hypothetical protein